MSEAVLPGHPDKFCDRVPDAIVEECYRADPRAYCQVEVSAWCDEVWVNGGLVTRAPLARSIEEIVKATGREIGYVAPNAIVADRYRVHDAVCQRREDPRTWTDHVNDQCITIGWAGYDAKVKHLPPEHWLAHRLAAALTESCRAGRLRGQGPDGKLLVRLRESEGEWRLEHLLVTLQQLPINTDAHSASDLDLLWFGVANARRGWVEARQVINTWDPEHLLHWPARAWQIALLLISQNSEIPEFNGLLDPPLRFSMR